MLREKRARHDAVLAEQQAVAQPQNMTQAVTSDGAGDPSREQFRPQVEDDVVDRETGFARESVGAVLAEQDDGQGAKMILKLALNFSAVGQVGSKARRLFEKSLVLDLASAADIPTASIRVLSMSPGSVIVELLVKLQAHHVDGPAGFVRSLQQQADDADSPLMKGILTRYTRSLCLSKDVQQATVAAADHPPARSANLCRSDADASLDLGIMTPGELEEEAKKKEIQDHLRHELADKEAQLYLLHRQIEGEPATIVVARSARIPI
jgi:hypothetical protein